MVRKIFECYIGGLDLSPYVRAIDFEEDAPAMIRYWNAHSRVFFRRKFIRAQRNALHDLAPFFLKKNPSVYLAVNGVFATYSQANIRIRDGKSLEISKVSSVSINLSGFREAIERAGIQMMQAANHFQAFFRFGAGTPNLIIPPRNDRDDVADAAEIAWRGGIDWGAPAQGTWEYHNARNVIQRYEAEGLEGRWVDFTGRLQENIDETLLGGDRDENE